MFVVAYLLTFIVVYIVRTEDACSYGEYRQTDIGPLHKHFRY